MDRSATGAKPRPTRKGNGLSSKLHSTRKPGKLIRPGGAPGGRKELLLGEIARPMRIMVVTDAWQPQINGVVRTLETLGTELKRLGHEVSYITPDAFSTVPMPTYPEIKLAVFAKRTVAKLIADFDPDAIHIATEGPIGLAARRYCQISKIPFTTSFHTRFPDYIHARFGLPVAWTYRALRWFHAPASAVMVATRSLERELKERGFGNLRMWSRGVDIELFQPGPKDWLDLPRPVHLYVGRVAVEKNVEAFCALDLPGSKLVVGNGPQLAELKAKYPEVRFVGPKFGKELARYYAASDVFVFPSKTDTFGLVILEALASGLPVVAYPVQGPIDILGEAPVDNLRHGQVGILSDDLAGAARRALELKPDACRNFALSFSWSACTNQFLTNLARPVKGRALAAR